MKFFLKWLIICVLCVGIGFGGRWYLSSIEQKDNSQNIEKQSNDKALDYTTDAKASYVMQPRQVEQSEQEGIWKIVGNNKMYMNAVGIPVANKEVPIEGVNYVFDENGFVKTNCLISVGEDTYWLDENGLRWNGWREIDGKWYFFDYEGRMIRNAKILERYTLDKEGALYYEE